MSVYVYTEDLAGGIVGPFDNTDAANDHVEFLRRRGDDLTKLQIMTEQEAHDKEEEGGCIRLTPEEDRAFKLPS